jgi:hypothetical protein
MLFRFTIISDEADEFLREIRIDADATFLDFCRAILKSCDYEDNQITSFYITNDEWEKQCEITREDMGNSPYDEDVYTMENTTLRSLLDDVPARLKFVFDTFNNRAFYIELKEMVPGMSIAEAEITRSIGEAPVQVQVEEKPAKKNGKTASASDDFAYGDFYGSEGFSDDELEGEGLDISDEPDGSCDPQSF